MNEKKVKETRKVAEAQAVNEAVAAPRIVNAVSINLMSDGTLNVSGPIKNPVFIGEIVGKAFIQLVTYYQAQTVKKSESGLILPEMN